MCSKPATGSEADKEVLSAEHSGPCGVRSNVITSHSLPSAPNRDPDASLPYPGSARGPEITNFPCCISGACDWEVT